MYNPSSRKLLEEISTSYYQRFNVRLPITSLVRSIDYQIIVNKVDPTSYKVKDQSSLPPHTSGCVFNISRGNLSVRQQNFLMRKLASMEQEGKLDASIIDGIGSSFQVFIYPDGVPPKPVSE